MKLIGANVGRRTNIVANRICTVRAGGWPSAFSFCAVF